MVKSQFERDETAALQHTCWCSKTESPSRGLNRYSPKAQVLEACPSPSQGSTGQPQPGQHWAVVGDAAQWEDAREAGAGSGGKFASFPFFCFPATMR